MTRRDPKLTGASEGAVICLTRIQPNGSIGTACAGDGVIEAWTGVPQEVTCPECLLHAATAAERRATAATADPDTARWAGLDRIARELRARATRAYFGLDRINDRIAR